MADPVESGLQNVRAEWVTSDLTGSVARPPTDPDWNRFSDYIAAYPGWTGDAQTEGARAVGSGDIDDHFRGPESHDLTVQWWMQRFFATVHLADPTDATTLGVASTNSGDTSLDVTIYNDDESVSETITTDGGDGTTFVTGSTSFTSVGRVTLASSATGDIEVSTDSGGSPGTLLGTISSGTTDQTDLTPLDPFGELLDYTYGNEFPVHELLFRRETTQGGNFGGGFREFIYAAGARPTSATSPGDPSASEPIIAEAGYTAEMVRQYVVHQPDGTITPQVSSTSANDTTQTVTIEDEGAGTSDTFQLSGTSDVTGDSGDSFSDIDAIWVDGDHEGDITVEDSTGANDNILEDPIVGSNTDGVDAYRGIPLLGSGSHSSAIGTDPDTFQFLGTSSSYDGGALAQSTSEDRVHALDLSIEIDVAQEPRQGTRRQAIDLGPRTVTAEADLAGPFETAKQNYQYFVGQTGDLAYGYPNQTIELQSAQIVDTDDVDYTADDSNIIYGVTFEAHGDPVLTVR